MPCRRVVTQTSAAAQRSSKEQRGKESEVRTGEKEMNIIPTLKTINKNA